MSIFTKDCPQCAETNAAYAVRCKCGFAFSADVADSEAQTEEEIALEEEKLYQEYLAARAKQANSAATDAAQLAAAQPEDQAKHQEAELTKAAAERAKTEAMLQTKRVVENTTETKPAKTEPPVIPAVAQTPKAESAPPTPTTPTSTPPVQPKAAEGSAERKQAEAKPPAAPVVAETPKVESAPPPISKAPTSTPPVQTTVPEGTTERKQAEARAPAVPQTPKVDSAAPATPKTPVPTPPTQPTTPAAKTQTQAPTPSADAKQSWLISGAESDARSEAPSQLSALKSAKTAPAKPATNDARPISTATNVAAAKMSAAERAKKLEQRLKAVQAKRDNKPAAKGQDATSKTDTSPAEPRPNPPSTSVAAAVPRPPATPAAATPAPANEPPQSLASPPAPKTDDTSAPPPSKLTGMVRKLTGMVLDTKSDQPQAVDKKTTPEPKKVNGTDTVSPASDTIEVSAAEEEVPTPSTNATAKADLEAALQALNTTTPATDSTVSTPTEGDNDTDQADAAPQELQDIGLGCTEKECPNCTALVPMDAESCACGFAFPTEDDAMPSLSLTDSDVEALEKRKKSSSISHLG